MRRREIKGIVHSKVFTNENDILKNAIVGKKTMEVNGYLDLIGIRTPGLEQYEGE